MDRSISDGARKEKIFTYIFACSLILSIAFFIEVLVFIRGLKWYLDQDIGVYIYILLAFYIPVFLSFFTVLADFVFTALFLRKYNAEKNKKGKFISRAKILSLMAKLVFIMSILHLITSSLFYLMLIANNIILFEMFLVMGFSIGLIVFGIKSIAKTHTLKKIIKKELAQRIQLDDPSE